MKASKNTTKPTSLKTSEPIPGDGLDRERIKVKMYECILKGWSRHDIFQEFLQGNITASALQKIYGEVKKMFVENNREDLEALKAEYVTKYNDLYKRAVESGNIKQAKSILDSLCNIQGIAKVIKVTGDFKVEWQ